MNKMDKILELNLKDNPKDLQLALQAEDKVTQTFQTYHEIVSQMINSGEQVVTSQIHKPAKTTQPKTDSHRLRSVCSITRITLTSIDPAFHRKNNHNRARQLLH